MAGRSELNGGNTREEQTVGGEQRQGGGRKADSIDFNIETVESRKQEFCGRNRGVIVRLSAKKTFPRRSVKTKLLPGDHCLRVPEGAHLLSNHNHRT